MERGSDFRVSFSLTSAGRTFHLDGYSVSFVVYDRKGGPVRYTATLGSGIVIDPSGGRVDILIPAAQMATFLDRCYYEFFLAPAGETQKFLRGNIRMVD